MELITVALGHLYELQKAEIVIKSKLVPSVVFIIPYVCCFTGTAAVVELSQ